MYIILQDRIRNTEYGIQRTDISRDGLLFADVYRVLPSLQDEMGEPWGANITKEPPRDTFVKIVFNKKTETYGQDPAKIGMKMERRNSQLFL